MGIGMKELATLAGVSQTTVSLVLNGKEMPPPEGRNVHVEIPRSGVMEVFF